MNFFEDAVGNGATGFAENDVLRTHTSLVYQRTYQCQGDERRRVEFDGVVVGDGVVHIEFDGNGLALLVASFAASMLLVEVREQGFPGLLRCRLARQLHHGFGNHRISLGLVVPAILDPKPRLAIPFGDTGVVNPCHTTGMNAASYADWFVGSDEKFGSLGIEVAEEHAVAVHGFAEQLDGSRRTQVGIFPCLQFPNLPTILVNLYGLYGGIQCVHGFLVPLIVPVVDDVAAIFQTNGLLGLCYAEFGRVHLPYGLSLAIDLLDMSLASGDEDVALGKFLYGPGKESFPAIDLLSSTVEFVNAAQ